MVLNPVAVDTGSYIVLGLCISPAQQAGHTITQSICLAFNCYAAFYIPTVVVPFLLVTHVLVFRILLRGEELSHRSSSGHG